MGKKVVTEHTRSSDQKEVYEEIESGGYCPFCPEHLAKNHKKEIIIDSKFWVVTESQWPYEGTKTHLLIISKRHATNVADLTTFEWFNFAEIVSRLAKEYDFYAGAICMRFGDPIYSAASVNHLHAQIIIPDPNAKKPVRFKIGKMQE